MAIARRAIGTFAQGTGAVSPGIPTGTVAGDFLLLFVETANQAVSTPTGWTLVQAIGGTAQTSTRLTIFSKTAGGSESAPSIADPGDHCLARIIGYSGVDTSNPFLDASYIESPVSSYVSTALFPSAGAFDGGMAVSGISWPTDSTTSPISSAAIYNTNASTVAFASGSTQGNGGGIAVIDGLVDGGASSVITEFFLSPDVDYAHALLVLRESTGPAPMSGTATGSITFTGTSAGRVQVKAASSGSIAFTGSSAGKVKTNGSASGSITFTGSSSGTVRVQGAATGAFGLTGASTGTVAAPGVNGTASGDLSFTGAATGAVAIIGAASGSFALTGASTGTVAIDGAASGDFTLTGSAAGTVPAKGAATGSIDLTGSSAGTVPVTGEAAGSFELTGGASGSGQTIAEGVASGSFAIGGSASGFVGRWFITQDTAPASWTAANDTADTWTATTDTSPAAWATTQAATQGWQLATDDEPPAWATGG